MRNEWRDEIKKKKDLWFGLKLIAWENELFTVLKPFVPCSYEIITMIKRSKIIKFDKGYFRASSNGL